MTPQAEAATDRMNDVKMGEKPAHETFIAK
jgi:hypothetical protein